MEQIKSNSSKQNVISSSGNFRNSVSKNSRGAFKTDVILRILGLVVFGSFSIILFYSTSNVVYREKLVVCLGIITYVLLLRFSNNNK